MENSPFSHRLVPSVKSPFAARAGVTETKPVETSPIPVSENSFGDTPMVVVPPKDPTITKAAEAGVVFDEGSPAPIRATASFAADERHSIDAFKKNLTEYYRNQGAIGEKESIDVRMGPATGELEFYNPKLNRYNLVNAPGVDVGDFAALSGDALVVVPDVAATIGITVVTANPVAGIAAGSAGTFAGEYARLKIGQGLGVNEDLSELDIVERSAKAAGISAAGGAGGALLGRIVKAVNNMMAGRTYFRDNNPLSDKDMHEAAEAAQEVNRRLGETRLKFTSGQATNDPDLLSIEEAFRKSRKFGGLSKFRDFDQNQALALSDFWREINIPVTWAGVLPGVLPVSVN